ncbi:MAG: Na/Pi cotransporter family protein [Pseudomonadota bacterium]
MAEHPFIVFLIHIAGAAALLIWSVRLVRTGVERGFSNPLRSWIRQSARNRFMATGSGLLAALGLQSATAVAVLVSHFVAKHGRLTAAVGLAMLLGADVGSALVTQLLVTRQPLLVPVLLLLGISLFLRGSGVGRPTGRIVIGLALIFVSLDMIRAATGPILSNPNTHAVVSYLGNDLLTAFAIGAVFAWAVHSSVAAVLLFVTLVGQSVLPLNAGVAMVLGANLGGAFIAHILTLSAPLDVRHMVLSNLLLRGGGAVGAAYILAAQPHWYAFLGAHPAQQAINVHLAFNAVLAVAALPFVGLVTSFVARLTPARSPSVTRLEPISALDQNAVSKPQRALDCTARELLAVGQHIEHMLIAVIPQYDTFNPDQAKAIAAQDKAIKKSHFDIKLYLAKIGQQELDESLSRRSMELVHLSSSLEAASDTINRVIVPLTQRMHAQGVQFSADGRKEISDFADRVLANAQLALNVMMNQNPAEARELVEAKELVRRVEQKLQRHHLGRLRQGLTESIETSNIHQETLRALKQVNTCFSVVAYPIVDKSGHLLESRLA